MWRIMSYDCVDLRLIYDDLSKINKYKVGSMRLIQCIDELKPNFKNLVVRCNTLIHQIKNYKINGFKNTMCRYVIEIINRLENQNFPLFTCFTIEPHSPDETIS